MDVAVEHPGAAASNRSRTGNMSRHMLSCMPKGNPYSVPPCSVRYDNLSEVQGGPMALFATGISIKFLIHNMNGE